MEKYKEEFISFLAASEALRFGEFTLKSGRKSPYFFTVSKFNTGDTVYKLGYYYASAAKENASEFDAVFGPAYNGIQLAVATSAALAKEFNIVKGYMFDRKEIKDYGDKGAFIGYEPKKNERVLLIDDVMTTGKTKEDAIQKLDANFPGTKISLLLIAVDRQETDSQGHNALKAFEERHGIPVKSIVTIREVLEYLYNRELNGKVILGDTEKKQIEDYLREYGI